MSLCPFKMCVLTRPRTIHHLASAGRISKTHLRIMLMLNVTRFEKMYVCILLSCPRCPLKVQLYFIVLEDCCQMHPSTLVDESLKTKDHLSDSICKAGFKESWGRCHCQRQGPVQAVTSICYSIAGGKLCKTTCYWFFTKLGRLLFKVYIWTILQLGLVNDLQVIF